MSDSGQRPSEPGAGNTDGGDESTSHPGPQVLDRALAILGLFRPESPEWTVTQAADACGLPVPTVHRILAALEHHAYVARNAYTKRYRLGVAVLELGRHASASIDLRTVSIEVLQSIAEATGETVLLTAVAPDRRSSVCLERVESRNPLRLSVEPGLRAPLHAGASQKALLAYMPEAEVDALLARDLPALCTATIIDAGSLREELTRIRSRGWTTSYQETDIGLWGIAITLLDDASEAVAAVGLAGPRLRLPKARVPEILDLLDEGSRTIASAIGLRSSSDPATATEDLEMATANPPMKEPT